MLSTGSGTVYAPEVTAPVELIQSRKTIDGLLKCLVVPAFSPKSGIPGSSRGELITPRRSSEVRQTRSRRVPTTLRVAVSPG